MSLPEKCPLCSADQNAQAVVTRHVFGEHQGQAIFRCEHCDIRYLFPGLSEEDEARLYAAEFEKFMEKRSASDAGWENPEAHIKANEVEEKRRSHFLSKHLPPHGRILEVGCSSGFMLHDLSSKGYECVGVEPSGVFSDYVTHRGIPCFNSLEALIENGEHKEGFDVILHYYVMEHIGDPQTFLRQQLELLKPNGILVFEVPNATDALSSLYDITAYEKFIWVVSHQWYFSQASMKFLLKDIGVNSEVHMDQRYDLSNHMTWALDGRPGGMGRFTDVFGAELEGHYKKSLIKAGMGDTLTVIIHKK
ncbi:MAG: hypothetical protein COB46_01310 [Rhodospirillaceae bacterium]|nr:MAG: hypothetical protein COB46_01310 [Rhodospirillaceae bacterium]